MVSGRIPKRSGDLVAGTAPSAFPRQCKLERRRSCGIALKPPSKAPLLVVGLNVRLAFRPTLLGRNATPKWLSDRKQRDLAAHCRIVDAASDAGPYFPCAEVLSDEVAFVSLRKSFALFENLASRASAAFSAVGVHPEVPCFFAKKQPPGALDRPRGGGERLINRHARYLETARLTRQDGNRKRRLFRILSGFRMCVSLGSREVPFRPDRISAVFGD